MNTTAPIDIALTAAPFATAVDHRQRPIVIGFRWRAAVAIGDLLAAMAIVLCIPFVILAIGIPIALCLRLLLWLFGML